MQKMKTLTLQGTTFEVVDEQARTDIATLQSDVTELQSGGNVDYDVIIECGSTANWNADKAGTYIVGCYEDVYNAIVNRKKISILVEWDFVYGEQYRRALIPSQIQLVEDTGCICLRVNANSDATWDIVLLNADGTIE